MLKDKKKIQLMKRLLPALILLICLLMSVGYTTVNYITLDIGGNVVAMEQEGVFVTDIKFKEGSGIHYANSNISVLKGTSLKHEIALSSTSNTSYITYIITVINSNDYDCQFKAAIYDEEFYDNQDIIYDLNDSVVEGDLIAAGETLDFEVTFKYIDGVTASENNNVLNAYINYEFIPLAILKSYRTMSTTAFRSSTYTNKFKNVSIQNSINIPENAIESWDIGVSQTGDVMAYVIANESDSSYYDLYIQSNTQLYANEDMSSWFTGMKYIDTLNGLEYMDTSNVTNMSAMFRETGYYSKTFTIDVSNFDTSNVTDMSYMFHQTGCQSLDFVLDLSNFVTNKVNLMNGMFRYAGHASTVFSLNVTGWDTSNVVNMSGMFYGMGVSSQSLHLDLKNFNTSNVIDMSEMFYSTGKSSPDVTLDISGFDTSKVTSMKDMFNGLGYSDVDFTLDITELDTSNVVNMSGMFNEAGYKSTTFSLDVSGFDTSKVTNMSKMFRNSGYSSQDFTLDVSNFKTSAVTDMSYMFTYAGYTDKDFVLNVSGFDTSNVTTLWHMFDRAGYNSATFTLDVGNWNTSKVTNMSYLFSNAGFNSREFDLDLESWDTSKVEDTSYMFYLAGFCSFKFNTIINITNPNTLSYTGMFATAVTQDGSQILVKYTMETSDLVDLMIATKGARSHVYKWYELTPGTEVSIGDETFNVVNDNGDSISLLAKFNIGTDYKQSGTANTVAFATASGWDYTPGPKEIDIQVWSSNPKTYVNGYVNYLNGLMGINNVKGDLLTGTQLIGLGCKFTTNYGFVTNSRSCADSPHYSWLINGQKWWLKSASSNYPDSVWQVWADGYIYDAGTAMTSANGIRPVITLNKADLINYLQ